MNRDFLLRAAIGEEWLQADRDTVGLAEGARIDLEELRSIESDASDTSRAGDTTFRSGRSMSDITGLYSNRKRAFALHHRRPEPIRVSNNANLRPFGITMLIPCAERCESNSNHPIGEKCGLEIES